MSETTAATAPVPLATRVRSYFLRHVQTAVGALGRMTREPMASAMTIAVIGIALALPAALQLLVVNGKAISGSWDSVADVSVYLQQGLSSERVTQLAAELEDWPEVRAVAIIDPGSALEEFSRASGFGEAMTALKDNPLPASLVVTPQSDYTDAESVAGLVEALELVPEADIVQVDTGWVKRFNAILELVRRAVILTAILLALAVVLIVGNTIRLDIQNRRAEIEVTKLVGGSDAFVRRPFLYSGLWFGLAGGLLALALIGTGYLLLRGPVARLAGEYGSGFVLHGADASSALGLFLTGGLLGWAGSWVATTRHLRRIEPS
ncbi:MAG: ABC transporter permease [Gammaproteobacteria bacterium]|nr:ABC transporter permease [Gammaproteobacteria bacterium]